MKELTIEEKAQRYDEAIERGKSLLSDNKIGNAWIYKLLPELAESEDEKESEDERIRKQLKAFIHSRASLITQSKHDSWIAWLEKQAFNTYNANKEYWRGYREGKQEILDKYAELEKQGEQKPVFEMKSAEESLGIDSDTYNKIVDECIYGEQKSAWSEEDECRRNILCHFLEEYGNQYYGNLMLQGTISWLKSLRPQKQWKPSDEQMKALDDVISSKDIKYDVLSELWKDLKKLREE